MTTLMHGGTPLDPDKVKFAGTNQQTTLRDLAHFTLGECRSVIVHLEPGDHTRYTLALAVVHEGPQPALWVTRIVGGDAVGTALLWSFNPYKLQFARLYNENEWSKTVLTWWLELLCEELDRVVSVRTG